METPLQAPSKHSLVECMRDLKFGRPAQQQLVIDEAINFIVARLGNDGPPFNPEIIDEVFNKRRMTTESWNGLMSCEKASCRFPNRGTCEDCPCE